MLLSSCYCLFSKLSHYDDVIIYDVMNFIQIFSIFELILSLSIPVQNFVVIGPQTMKIMRGVASAPPPNLRMSKKPIQIRVKVARNKKFEILIIHNFFSCHLMVKEILYIYRTCKYIAKTEVEIFVTVIVSIVTI